MLQAIIQQGLRRRKGTDSNSSSYVLNTLSRTSAGVYKTDGTQVRELWANVHKTAGTYPIDNSIWNGLDNDGIAAPAGTYDVVVKATPVTGGLTYEWQGVIGNTSTNKTGDNVWNEWDQVHDMVGVGDYMYVACGYPEGHNGRPSQWKFQKDAPNIKLRVTGMPTVGNAGQKTVNVCSDGVNVYWAGIDPFSTNPDTGTGKYGNYSFVFSTAVSNDAQVNFSSGTAYTTWAGTPYTKAINVVNSNNSTYAWTTPSGMAVQKTGNLLFVARKNMNTIHVVNKTTGALIATNSTFTNPRHLWVDGNDKLWVVSGANTIARYTVNSAGVFTADNVTITGIGSPLYIGGSPVADLLLVSDATTKQVKGFTYSTGAAVSGWTLGISGGYTNSPAVANDKFHWMHMTRGDYYAGTYTAFQADGTKLWVGDPGTKRNQHFNSSRTFINTLAYSSTSRNCGIDGNNHNRIFSDFLEYSDNKSTALTGSTGWAATYNWAGNVTEDNWHDMTNMRYVNTLSNGRTYAFVRSDAISKYLLCELNPATGMRITTIPMDTNIKLNSDGSLTKHPNRNIGSASVWKKKVRTGFDGSNNPVWEGGVSDWNTTYTLIGQSPAITANDPISGFITPTIPATEVSDNGVLVSFDEHMPVYYQGSWQFGSLRYHLGGIKDSKWLWRTAKTTGSTYNANGTKTQYTGPYPNDGKYDDGNGVTFAGGMALTKGNHTFWSHHGEFFKGGQTNKWQHVDATTGLLLGIFGKTRGTGSPVDYSYSQNAPAEMAGNALTGAICQEGNDYYIYHCDESDHSGVHRWKVTGLNTIQEHKIAISK